MARFHITATGSQAICTGARKILIQNNKALTGTITVTDGVGTVAVITDPAVGNQFEYWSLTGAITVNPSAICEITVNTDGSHGPK